MKNVKTEIIHLDKNYPLPEEYSCRCKYCFRYLGMLIRPNGEKYNKNDRRQYYFYKRKGGSGHINPTPHHAARWAIQALTRPGDWVCDPFMGTGTTAVEAINHSRKVVGTELETVKLARYNCKLQSSNQRQDFYKIYKDDAQNIHKYIKNLPIQLSVWQPPYSGDEQSNAKYNRDYSNNLAFLKETPEYWRAIDGIMKQVIEQTRIGGYAIICVKEMMRNKKWWDIHIKLGILMSKKMNYRGMVLLPHYPRTLHLNTYFQRWGVHPSYWQTILIFRKGGRNA